MSEPALVRPAGLRRPPIPRRERALHACARPSAAPTEPAPARPRAVTAARAGRDGGARHARSRARPERRERAGAQGPRARRSIWRRATARPKTRCAPPPPLAPADAEIAYDLGRIFYQQRRHPQAADAFRRAIAIDPRAYKAWDNLGLTLEALGDPAQATRHYLKAMEIAQTDQPRYDVVYANYADLLIKQGDYQTGIRCGGRGRAAQPARSPATSFSPARRS